MMRRTVLITLITALVVTLFGAGLVANAEGQPSAKATAQIDCLHVMSVAWTDSDYDFDFDIDGDEILEQTIKTAEGKDLFIDVSLQSGVYTGTTVKSKDMDRDTSSAAASVFVWVWVDKGTPDARLVFPGPVVYNARIQTLTAVLQGEITGIDGLGDPIIDRPEEIGLFIGTMSANAFNFIIDDLSSGTHTVTVKAMCMSSAMNERGCASSMAVIGLGSMTIEEVRMIQGEDAIPEWWN